jgi:hypothetical protein
MAMFTSSEPAWRLARRTVLSVIGRKVTREKW